MHVFYLHGFASSPRSSKATFLAERLAPHGLRLHCPDFNLPEFSTLTVSRMLAQLTVAIEALPAGPVVLIGSSLGSFVAVEFAAFHPVQQLILLAPALELRWDRWHELDESGLGRWRSTDRLEVFHYGYGETRSLRFALYEDAQQYDAARQVLTVPTVIVQGTRDTSVDPAVVEHFAASRPSVRLHLVDDDHQLLGSLELVWQLTADALGLPARAGGPAV
jgi:pimeloyl-ACP methyl ester carboxylesterase